jgi:Serine carboxypeptidase.
VYSGDTDGAVPTTGTARWIQKLVNQFNLIIEVPQTQWYLPDTQYNNNQIGGYYTVYQGLAFVTVKGVGHMVPQWERPGALKILKYLLYGNPLH